MIVTYEEALCIYFNKKYNDQNAQELRKKLQRSYRGGMQLVYRDNPKLPTLVHFSEVPDRLCKPYITKQELFKKLR
jgi:hypothetical protein